MISLEGRRIALIGGAGFIGHHLALRLKAQGAHVDIIDGLQVNNLVTFMANTDKVPNRDLYLTLLNQRIRMLQDEGISLHIQDARDYAALSHLMNALRPQVVVMLAAVAHAGRANKNPYNTFDHSMRTLENALDCSRDNIEHFVYFSSSMVYGQFPTEAVTETTPCEPLGIYGALKFGGEKLVIAYNQVFDLPYTIVRPSALYGERCVSRRVAQVLTENALKGLPLKIQGDGSERLDFTDVNDLVSGVVQVLRHEESRNQIFNMTYGSSRSISDLVEILREEVPEVEVTFEAPDDLMPERGTLDVTKAKTMIGYGPEWPLEKGVRRYLGWYRDLFAERPDLLKAE
jgi:nucleoside-diphosphate-sugar epimerase